MFAYTGRRGVLRVARLFGSESARAELTASEAGRCCDDQSFELQAAFGCIKGPSAAGKKETP